MRYIGAFAFLFLIGDMPDGVGIVGNGTVGGEDAAAGDVVEAHAVPLLPVGVGLHHALFRLAVRLEIRQEQVLVGRAAAAAKQQALIQILIPHAVPEAGPERVQAAAQLLVPVVQALGHIALPFQALHLVGVEAEEEHILVAHDPICKDKLQVVFLENYRVSLAEHLMPASEVSQQISTAGKEASGTGNMKFMMNGALTIGTLDGANVEMHQQLGNDNIFLFGLTAQEVVRTKDQGYAPLDIYSRNASLKRVIDQLSAGFRDGVSYADLTRRLLFGAGGAPADEYLLLADFDSYCQAHCRALATYADPKKWNRMSLVNIARSGIFAADRSIRDYAENIWHVPVREED